MPMPMPMPMPMQWGAPQRAGWQAQSDVAGYVTAPRSLGIGSRQAAPGDHAHTIKTWGGTDRITADTTVANSVTETNLVSFTVLGGNLGIDKRIRITIDGDLLYNNNVADTLTVRLKFGATTLAASATAAPGALSATRSQFRLVCELSADGATNAQYGVLHWIVTAPQAMAAGTGGQYGAANYLPQLVGGTAAIDDTADATLAVTVQWGAASANNSLIARWALVEVV